MFYLEVSSLFVCTSSWSSLAFQSHSSYGLPPVSRGAIVPQPSWAGRNPRFFQSVEYLGCLDWTEPGLIDNQALITSWVDLVKGSFCSGSPSPPSPQKKKHTHTHTYNAYFILIQLFYFIHGGYTSQFVVKMLLDFVVVIEELLIQI